MQCSPLLTTSRAEQLVGTDGQTDGHLALVCMHIYIYIYIYIYVFVYVYIHLLPYALYVGYYTLRKDKCVTG